MFYLQLISQKVYKCQKISQYYKMLIYTRYKFLFYSIYLMYNYGIYLYL
jgi:hypothetical protein